MLLAMAYNKTVSKMIGVKTQDLELVIFHVHNMSRQGGGSSE